MLDEDWDDFRLTMAGRLLVLVVLPMNPGFFRPSAFAVAGGAVGSSRTIPAGPGVADEEPNSTCCLGGSIRAVLGVSSEPVRVFLRIGDGIAFGSEVCLELFDLSE